MLFYSLDIPKFNVQVVVLSFFNFSGSVSDKIFFSLKRNCCGSLSS